MLKHLRTILLVGVTVVVSLLLLVSAINNVVDNILQRRETSRQSPKQTGTHAPSSQAGAVVPTPSPNPSTQQPQEPSKPTPRVGSPENGRTNYAILLQRIYKTEGRILIVEATGERYETLELHSGLIFDGSHTLDAAEQETILCAECMKFMGVSIVQSYVAPTVLINLLMAECANQHRTRTVSLLKETAKEQQNGFRWYVPS